MNKTTGGDVIITCSQCGQSYYLQNGHTCKNDANPGRWTTGGNGSHWYGCEEVHWDCKIAKLEAENARLKEALKKIANDDKHYPSTYDELLFIARHALEDK